MDNALFYVIERFFYRLRVFVEHWYVGSFRKYSDFSLNFLSRLDYHLAWKITLKHIFQPLYRDYTFLGYVLGFLFRSVRLVVASVIYLVVFVIMAGLYLFWLLVPPIIIYLIFNP